MSERKLGAPSNPEFCVNSLYTLQALCTQRKKTLKQLSLWITMAQKPCRGYLTAMFSFLLQLYFNIMTFSCLPSFVPLSVSKPEDCLCKQHIPTLLSRYSIMWSCFLWLPLLYQPNVTVNSLLSQGLLSMERLQWQPVWHLLLVFHCCKGYYEKGTSSYRDTLSLSFPLYINTPAYWIHYVASKITPPQPLPHILLGKHGNKGWGKGWGS